MREGPAVTRRPFCSRERGRRRAGSVLVVVLAVGRVLVPVMHVVDVVVVRDSFVFAVRAVFVLGYRMLGDALVLVIVVAVSSVMMGAVHVVDMVDVRDSLVSAGSTVFVLGHRVLGVDLSCAHQGFLCQGRPLQGRG